MMNYDQIDNVIVNLTLYKKYLRGDKNVSRDPKFIYRKCIELYLPPKENFHVSIKAANLMNSISDDSLENYYADSRIMNTKGDITLKVFKNRSHSYESKLLERGKSTSFSSLFTYEHVTPNKNIRMELEKLSDEDITRKNVEKILNKIHICRITKEEDCALDKAGFRSKRPLDFDDVIENCYSKVGIKLVK